jgi:hypothetical protein
MGTLVLAWSSGLGLPALGQDSRPAPAAAVQTEDRQAAAQGFVGQHHPELLELLTYLERHQPRAYGRAIDDLYRVSQRLAEMEQSDLERYQLELRVWQTKSRIQLLAARYQMSRDPVLLEGLQQALREQADLQLTVWAAERRRLVQRLARIDAQRAQLTEHRDETIARQLDRLTGARPQQPDSTPPRPRAQQPQRKPD